MGCWVVTGGASGIGLQLVRDLLAQGHQIRIWDIKEPPAMEGASFDKVDLTDPQAITAAAGRVSGEVDCFIHCAGVYQPTSVLHDNLVATMDLAYKIHCVAFVVAVQALLDRFTEKTSIIAITSAGADMVYPGTLAYGPSKSALQRAVIQLAVELGGRGIRVNAISPGAIATDMTKHMWEDPEFRRERVKHIPLGRQGDPSVISNAVIFLASEAASYVSGETLWVDGGVRRGIFQPGVRETMEAGAKKA